MLMTIRRVLHKTNNWCATNMRKAKISYLVQSVIGMVVWILLTVIVSIKIASAEQLTLTVKVAIWGFLWALVAYFIYVLIRYYRKLDETSLD